MFICRIAITDTILKRYQLKTNKSTQYFFLASSFLFFFASLKIDGKEWTAVLLFQIFSVISYSLRSFSTYILVMHDALRCFWWNGRPRTKISSEAPEMYLISFIMWHYFLVFEALLVSFHYCGEEEDTSSACLVYWYITS